MPQNRNSFQTHHYYSPNPQRRPMPARRSFLRSKLPIITGVIAIVALGAFFVRPKSAHEAEAKPPAQSQAAQIKQLPAKNVISDEEMAAAINKVISTSPDVDTSVSITHLPSGKTYHYGLTVQFDEASIGKLLTATNYLRHVERGDLALDQVIGGVSAQQNLQLMIEQSDNVAWKNLNDLLTHEDLMSFANIVGLKGYDADKNTIDSDAIALLLTKLYTGDLLNKNHTQLLLGYMKNANRKDFIVASVPSGISAYHKAGWLEDRNHDAAIIDDGRDPYVLVIFTNGQRKYHPVPATTMIEQITKATVQRFIGKSV